MSKQINILFAASEVVPFAKTGGLADVAGALPIVIKELGHEVRIAMPRYACIGERKHKLHDIVRLHAQAIPIAPTPVDIDIKSSFLTNSKSKVQVYFIENPRYFGREGLYQDPANKNKDYPDNDERFILFCRAILETLKRLGWQPDIIHCNDWQTGLIPVYLKTLYRDDPFFKNTRTVLTVHNLAYQGNFPASSFRKTGLPAQVFQPDGVEFFGSFNFLKAGLVYADAITTVSQKYAEEIRTQEEFGCGLSGVLEKRKEDLYGILNGIDYREWSPESDSYIPARYGPKNISGKKEDKLELLRRMRLPTEGPTLVLGMISRLADQKGFDLLQEAAEGLLRLPIQLVILGTGEKKYHDFLDSLRSRHPGKVAVELGFSTELAHLIEAGADAFLMPSRYEPCGLNQLYSMKYGTIPVVRATGGLDDTVENYDPATGAGTGFKFVRYDARELLEAVGRAVRLFADRGAWEDLMRSAMGKDFSWEVSARKYIQVYRKIIK